MMTQKTTNTCGRWPTFLVIGAAKSGTTSLQHYLAQHPEVYLSPKKEPNYFSMHGAEFTGPAGSPAEAIFDRIMARSVVDTDAYLDLFTDVQDERAVGEISPGYLYHPGTAMAIHQQIPNVKLIAVLRNPIERAYSMYLHQVRKGRERRSFDQALQQEPIDSDNIWDCVDRYYLRPGLYARQIKPYLELFDREHLRIYLYEDLDHDPLAFFRDIYRFLDVDSTFVPDLAQRHTVSGVPKNDWTHNMMLRLIPIAERLRSLSTAKNFAKKLIGRQIQSRLKKVSQDKSLLAHFDGDKNESVVWKTYAAGNFSKPCMSLDTRERVVDFYRNDIRELEKLLRRDLSAWLETPAPELTDVTGGMKKFRAHGKRPV